MKKQFTLSLILWMFALTVFSTSHMGIAHHYAGPIRAGLHQFQSHEDPNESDPSVCDWKYATRLLVSDQIIHIFSHIETNKIFTLTPDVSCPCLHQESYVSLRGPPASSMI